MNPSSPSTTGRGGIPALVHHLIKIFELTPHWFLALLARVSVASVFWRSARTKVEGFKIKDSTFLLFEHEYDVPLVPPDVAAYMATVAEHVLPVLLVIGLASRFSALGLLAMTIVIQLFVYPSAWPTHILWVMGLAYVIARGPGVVSLDHLIAKRAR